MPLFCSSCNAPSPSEARFCRLCGAPLKTTSGASGPVSPLAQTVPLAADPRTTDGLPGEDPRRSADTVRVSNGDLDAILEGRHVGQPRPAAANDRDGTSAPLPEGHFAAPTTSSLVMPAQSAAQNKVPHKKRWWPILLVSLLLVALAGALLIYYFTHRRSTVAEPPVVATDQNRTVELQLAEARSLLSSGSIDEAANKLHSVIDLDPSNVEAHRLLGQALMRKGLRRQAIDEYFIAAQKDPQDLPTLHALASLQFQEHLYADAVDSYRRLIAAMGEATLASQDELDYADSLRFAGYTEDARNEYQKVIATAPEDIVGTAKKHLAQLPAATATSTPSNTSASATGTPGRTNGSTTSAVPAPTAKVPVTAKPSPSPAQANPDADYSLGVSIVRGRDPRNMPRAELLRALEIFQRASRGGPHRAQAQSLAERLGQEFDRRRRLGIQ